MSRHNLGWLPDTPDPRDRLLHSRSTLMAVHAAGKLPRAVDLRHKHKWPACYDQGALGSCIENAGASLIQYEQLKMGKPLVMPARLAPYYDVRKIEHTIRSDAGGQIRDYMKVAAKKGVGPESLSPYDTSTFTHAPSIAYYKAATENKIAAYSKVQVSTLAVRAALASDFPVIFGITLFESFESDAVEKSSIVPMPDINNEKAIGGHCMSVVGYNDDTQRFTVRNSWSPTWGKKGYCEIPYAYLCNSDYADDFWTLQP